MDGWVICRMGGPSVRRSLEHAPAASDPDGDDLFRSQSLLLHGKTLPFQV
jgi:hypothetical protein